MEKATENAPLLPGGEIAPGQAVEVEHPFQRGDVGGDIQRIGLKELVQLVFKSGHQQIHRAFDALFGFMDVGPLHPCAESWA